MKTMRYAFLSLALTATACGGPEPEDVAKDLATEICELSFRCCTGGEVGYHFGPFVTSEDCADRLTNSASLADELTRNIEMFENIHFRVPNLHALSRAVGEGRTEVDEDAVDACLEYLRSTECNALEEIPDVCVPPELLPVNPCDPEVLFRGKLGEGDSCSSPDISFECKEGLACRVPEGTGVATGACVALGGVGDYCFDDDECNVTEDLYCSLFDGTCQKPSQVGEVCAYADRDSPAPSGEPIIRCAYGLSCDPVSDTCVAPCERGAACFADIGCDAEAGLFCIGGRCDTPRAEGLPCDIDENCQEGLLCLPSAAEFGALLCTQPLAVGDDCSPAGGHDDCESGFCDPGPELDVYECGPAVEPGGKCPTELHQQCDEGYCDNIATTGCTDNAQCSISGECDFRFGSSGYCVPHCVPARNDGQTCLNDFECVSGECISGTCRTLPLADGQGCELDTDCESLYCGVDFPRVCDTPPLPNGTACSDGFYCESGICFNGECSQGLTEGSTCGDFGQAPCGPELYCDPRENPPACAPILDTGAECLDDFQCRGFCVDKFGRSVCDDTPPLNGLVCDGGNETI